MGFFGFLSAIGLFFDSVPILRSVWRAVLERQLSVEVLPQHFSSGRDDKIIYLVAIERDDERGPERSFIAIRFALRFINNRTDRKERIIGAYVVMKKRRLWLWKKEILRFPVCERPAPPGDMLPISNIELEPMSAPLEIRCEAESGSLDPSVRDDFPARFSAFLELDMVGPMRRLTRFMQDFNRPGFNLWDRLKPGW